MKDGLFPPPVPVFASTRKDALEQLDAFIPAAGRYSSARNHVPPFHTNVSRLSPAIRHRLILESECAAAPLRRYAASTLEKFTQEAYWRRYWKNWLSLRPQVWTYYLDQLAVLQNDPHAEATRARCEAGESPLASRKPSAILATGDIATWTRFQYPEHKINWLQNALTDAAMRAGSAFGIRAQSFHADFSVTDSLLRWASENQLQQIAAMRPEIGPLHDQLPEIQTTLTQAGIDLVLTDRPEDLAHRPLATAGFFGFWEKMRQSLKDGL